jgi:predicted nucleotidyltransferase
MINDPGNDPILTRFCAALEQIYGARIDRVVLFGSRARGDARPDSDYDVAVFLTELPDRWKELDRLADLSISFIDNSGAFFDAKPYLASSYQDRTPLMHEIRREGLTLWPLRPHAFSTKPIGCSSKPTPC